MDYPVPADESARLEALRKLQLLDTLGEEAYDSITELIAEVLDMPIALISLVDEDRQWFKSKIGLDRQSTSREVAFCTYNILDDDMLIVEDALEDERFATNPLVLEDPNIRFYAGSPLHAPSGHRVGSLCVIDNKPRTLDSRQLRILEALGKQVDSLFKIRQISHELHQSRQLNRDLKRLLPICTICGRVKQADDWAELEEYIQSNTSEQLSRQVCPDCSADLDENFDLV